MSRIYLDATLQYLGLINGEHKVYPYLLRDVQIKRPDHVWSTDISYIRIGKGFVYLTAVIDWFSRYVLSWRLSNTLENTFCALMFLRMR